MATATYGASLTSAEATAGDAGSQASHCVVWKESARTNAIASFDLNAVLAGIVEGQAIEFANNQLVFTLTLGSGSNDPLTEYGLAQALRGIFRENRYLSWHTGSPGNNYTANRIAGIPATLITVSNMVYSPSTS